jgi:hypothetical protein
MRSKDETLRRLRVGNIKTLLRWRCGAILPDDDAGREYLYELLLPVSLSPLEPDLKMRNIIEVWAPWVSKAEAVGLIDRISLTPIHYRKVRAKELGERLMVTSAERKALRLWTIAAHDADDVKRAEERRANQRARDQRRRRRAGQKPRADYLTANAVNRQKPWVTLGISRTTWYERRKVSRTGPPRSGQVPHAVKLG